MKQRMLSVFLALALGLSQLPGLALAAEGVSEPQVAGTPTRTEALTLTTEAAENTDEGWKWEPDENGGTLTLTNCHIQSPDAQIITFPVIGEKIYTIVLNGENILETTSTKFTAMIRHSNRDDSGTYHFKSDESAGSLEFLVTNAQAYPANNPYGFSGHHLNFENVTIKSNVTLCMFQSDFTMRNCTLTIDGGTTALDGIYSTSGPIKIIDSDIDITVYGRALFIDWNSSLLDITERSIEISGGTAKLSSSGGYQCFCMTSSSSSGTIFTNLVKISNGAKVNCTKGTFRASGLSVEGEGTEMTLTEGNLNLNHPTVNTVSIDTGAKLTLDGVVGSIITTEGSNATLTNESTFIISRKDWLTSGKAEQLTLSGNGGFYCAELDGGTVTIADSEYTGADQKDTLDISVSGSQIIKETEFLPLAAYGLNNMTLERQNGDNWTVVTEVKDAGTYRASYQGNILDTFTIAPKPLTVKSATAATRPYDGTNQVEISAVALDGVIDGDTVSVDTTGLTGTITGTDAGEYDSVTLSEIPALTGADAGNYTLTQPTGPVPATVTISKADYTGEKTAETSGKFGVSKTFDFSSLLPAGAKLGTISVTDSDSIFVEPQPALDGTVLSYTLANDSGKAGKTATITVPVTSSTNYNGFDLTITITVSDKYIPTLAIDPIQAVYTGKPVPDSVIKGAATVEGTTVDGSWSFNEGQNLTNVADSGEKTVTFTPTNGTDYAQTTGKVSLTINKAAPTGDPTYTAITASGKTLADAALTAPAGWPAGTLTWELPEDTAVTSGTSYNWTFTPEDTDNYNAASGAVILWKTTSGGGSGGTYIPPSSGTSGTSNTPKLPVSTTGQNSSGVSTTTTAVPPANVQDGTATADIDTAIGQEIIKQAVANESGSVVIAPEITGDVCKTQVSIPAATVGEIGTQTGASLTVSTPVADVTLPNGGLSSLASAGGMLTVSAEKTGNTVELSVTAGGKPVESIPGGLTLAVPVPDATPGTVAVLVREDGTRQVVRKSVAGGGSITIPLDGSARLEIVDNSRQFSDVPAGSWAADAIAFASAHELFSGTGGGQFSPDLPMSRGMLAVVLHNLESNPNQALTGLFSDVGSSKWYAEGIAWAAENGIVNGYGNGTFGPDDGITREQLAVMLWRYAGSPAPAAGELHFNDADQVSSWALDAMRWAVENGILNGYGNGSFGPKDGATRAQVAQMLKNLLSK